MVKKFFSIIFICFLTFLTVFTPITASAYEVTGLDITAKAGMLMTAFTAIGGVPSTGNKWLVKDVLRDEWGYDGVVITDYGSINTMQGHSISSDDECLAKYEREQEGCRRQI